ncbi:hypothetical protein GCM10028857_20150 [Salinarchaeum chitinilyticum]
MTGAWLLAGLVVAGGAVAVVRELRRAADRPGVLPATSLVALLGTLALAVAIVQTAPIGLAPGAPARMGLLAGCVFASLCWIAFVVAYTGRGPAVTSYRAVGLGALGVATVASTAITWLHEIDRVELGTIGELSYIVTFFLQIGVFSLGLLGVVLLVRSTIGYDDLPVRRGGGLALAGLGVASLPLSIWIGQELGGATAFSIAAVQIGGIVGLIGLVQRRDGLFEPAPTAGHLARERVLETIAAPIVVTDRDHRLLDVNAAARETFGVGDSPLRELTLPSVAGVDAETELSGPVSIRTTAGRREFAVTRNEIAGNDDGPLGFAYRFRDVTDRQTREQRLEVLNRLLRHDLRNDLDAIRGFAEPVRDGRVEAGAAQFDRIEGLASDLVELSAAVDRSGRLLSGDSLAIEPCDLRTVAEARVAEVNVADAAGTVDVSIDAPDRAVRLDTDTALLRLLLDELLDNAIEHSDRERPTVTVRVAEAADGATLAVADDGPGIPEYERNVLVEGAETPVAHGSGIGLWIVHWATAKLGGRLEFAANEPRGTVVSVHLPDLAASQSSSLHAG